MKTYLAGTPGINSREIAWQKLSVRRLLSYWDIQEEAFGVPFAFKLIKRKHMTDRKVDLFLDSGAFSAWTQGTSINIDEYIKFIKANQDIIEIYANLDGIPKKAFKQWDCNDESAKLTLDNQQYMERAGLSPLPCFHYGEPYKYLDYYVKHYEYMALGVAGNAGAKLIPWLNECFAEHICDENGFPKLKVHGFAVTSLDIMMRYPWWSVDSTSWVLTGRMGSIFIPRGKDGNWKYNITPWKVAVSSRSPRKKESDKHIDTCTIEEKRIYLSYIESKGYKLGKSEFKKVDVSYIPKENERWNEPAKKSGLRELEVITEDGLSNRYQLRDEINIIYFLDLEKNFRPWPWSFKTKEVQHGLEGF